MDQAELLQGLVDKAAIAEVIYAYCYHFDRNEPEAFAALFTADALVDYGPGFPELRGVEAIGTAVARGLKETFAATSHHVSNIVVTLERPDRARSVSYLYAWHRYHADVPDGELWAQYHHEFERTPGGWKISRLVLKAAGMENFHRSQMHPIGRK